MMEPTTQSQPQPRMRLLNAVPKFIPFDLVYGPLPLDECVREWEATGLGKRALQHAWNQLLKDAQKAVHHHPAEFDFWQLHRQHLEAAAEQAPALSET